jgi:hypothetical protein
LRAQREEGQERAPRQDRFDAFARGRRARARAEGAIADFKRRIECRRGGGLGDRPFHDADDFRAQLLSAGRDRIDRRERGDGDRPITRRRATMNSLELRRSSRHARFRT